jgi:hypothetical protein
MRYNFVQESIGKGNICLTMRVGEHEVKGVLHEVLHVPSLVKDHFSVSKAIVQSLKIEFEQEECNNKNDFGEIL